MAEFGEYIEVGDDIFEFRFAEVVNPGCEKYFVYVCDGQVQVVSFEIRKQSSTWEIIPPAPNWIKELEGRLNNIITRRRT